MKAAFLLAAGVIAFAACSKHSDAPKTTIQMMNGNWIVKEIDQHEFVNDSLKTYVFQGKDGDHFNFGTDGILDAAFVGTHFTIGYEVKGDTMTMGGTVLFHIESLTNKTLTLHGKVGINAKDYTEVWYNLIK